MKWCFAAIVIATLASASQAEDKQPGPYAPMPWHLVDLWWDLGADLPFESYNIDVEVTDNVSPAVNLYIAPIGLGHLSKVPFYGGLQTQADGYTKRDQRLGKIGPGGLFSMWGERSLDAIRPSIGGYCQSSGHEGDFVSVRRAYAWSKGTYTYRIVRMDKQTVDGKPCTWVGAFVYSHANDENVFIGALRFPGENLALSRKVASFVEIYGDEKPISEIPKLTVKLGNLRVNGNRVAKPTAVAIYPDRVPDYAEAEARNGSVVIRVGQAVENRTKRRVELIGP